MQLQLQGALIPAGPNAIPAMPLLPAMPLHPGNAPVPAAPAPGVAPAAAAHGNSVHLDMATMRLKVMSAQLEALRKGESMKDASPEKKAELKKQMDELTSRVDELRKQLEFVIDSQTNAYTPITFRCTGCKTSSRATASRSTVRHRASCAATRPTCCARSMS